MTRSTKKTAAALRWTTIVAAGVVAVAGCQSVPRILSRPVAVQEGGLDCAGATLVELGYTITDGDRATGFIRGERQVPASRWPFVYAGGTDILMVSETTSDGSESQLNVTASHRSASAETILDEDAPRDEGKANAEQLLERGAGASGNPPVGRFS
ncbi:MAG: hypothetical protein F4Y21_05715 [Gemmatimonadetes bacterium]|nr:hypothetical protein [Gemmatimonadota bacterium]